MYRRTFKRILLVMPPAVGLEADVRYGVFKYARPQKPWNFLLLAQKADAITEQKHRAEKAAGGLGKVGRKDLAEAANSLDLPFVNIYGGAPLCDLPQVGTDDRLIGKMAAEYLAEKGFRSFGFYGVGSKEPGFATGRAEGFAEELHRRGLTMNEFDPAKAYPPIENTDVDAVVGTESMYRWVAHLPKPAAIFACDDTRAVWVSNACWMLGLHVPDEVALLGVDNNKTYCHEAYPPISSIEIAGELEGYQAAALLDRLLQGKKPPSKPVLLKPVGVVSRQSTDTLAIADLQVARAIRYIHEHACDPIDVEDVVKQTSLSRRILENRFRAIIQRTPFQEIRRTQIERIKELLSKTDTGIEQIADATGFSNRIRLSLEFKKHTGIPVVAYRKQFRHR